MDALARVKRELPTAPQSALPFTRYAEVTAESASSFNPGPGIGSFAWCVNGAPFRFLASLPLVSGASVTVSDLGDLKVEEQVGDGKAGTVYRLRSNAGSLFALKVAHRNFDPNILSEPGRLAYLEQVGVNPSTVVASGSDFVLKRWVEGTLGDDWLSDDKQGDCASACENLAAFLGRCATARVLIKDLKPRNVVLDQQFNWYCIDPGALIVGAASEQLLGVLGAYVLKHWFGVRYYSPGYLWAKYFGG